VAIPTPIDSNPRASYTYVRRSRGIVVRGVAKASTNDPRADRQSRLDELNYQSLPEARLAQGAEAFGFVALVSPRSAFMASCPFRFAAVEGIRHPNSTGAKEKNPRMV
jgi:hypothetical protein